MRGTYCVRCKRAAPVWGDPHYAEWESAGEDGDMLCPDCFVEHREIDQDAMAMAAEALGFGTRARRSGSVEADW